MQARDASLIEALRIAAQPGRIARRGVFPAATDCAPAVAALGRIARARSPRGRYANRVTSTFVLSHRLPVAVAGALPASGIQFASHATPPSAGSAATVSDRQLPRIPPRPAHVSARDRRRVWRRGFVPPGPAAVPVGKPSRLDRVCAGQEQQKLHQAVCLSVHPAGVGQWPVDQRGQFWLRQRRLAAPAFRADRIASYAPDMVAATTRMLDSWNDGQTRDIHADMMHVTLDLVARTLFGADISHEASISATRCGPCCGVFRPASTAPFPGRTGSRPARNREARAAVRTLNAVVQKLVDERRDDREPRSDLLSMIMHARDEDGSRMTDDQLADEARTLSVGRPRDDGHRAVLDLVPAGQPPRRSRPNWRPSSTACSATGCPRRPICRG